MLKEIIALYPTIMILALLFGSMAYKYFLQINSTTELLKLLLISKMSILLLATPLLIAALGIIQLILFLAISQFSFGKIIYNNVPLEISVFLFGAWFESAKAAFIFSIELIIYITIGSSFFEYKILCEKRKNRNSKSQIVKAILWSTFMVALGVQVYFVYLYNITPDIFE